MKRGIVLLACLLLCACVIRTAAGYKKILDSWMGAPETELVHQWGPPMRFYDSGDTRYLTYSQQRSGYVPGTSPTYTSQVIGNTIYTTASGGSPGYTYTLRCETTFEIRGGRVVFWRTSGNDCVAVEK